MSGYWHAEALAGGTVNLSGLTTINEPNAGVQFTADGSGSQLNLSALTSFTEDGGNSTFEVTNGATVHDEQPDHLQRSPNHPRRYGQIATSQWTTLTSSSLTITGGAYTLPSLTDITLTSLQLSGGATLSLPALRGQPAAEQRPKRYHPGHPGEYACCGNFGCHYQRAPVPGFDPDPAE